MRIGTDNLPLLVNLCSEECKEKLPESPKGYVNHAHKGGANLKQPSYEEWEKANVTKISWTEIEKQNTEDESPKLLNLIRKIWQ